MNPPFKIPTTPRWQTAAGTVALAGAAFWIFWPVLHGFWIWDDNVDVAQNPILRSASGLWSIWFQPGSQIDYYPVKATVQWLQWQFWGDDTLGYHLTNVILHITGALLFWRVLARLGLKQAWLGAFIFTVHPVQVESVAWIAELKNTLSTPLFLLCALFYLEYDEKKRARDYALAAGFFLIAMLTKPAMVMFPVVLLLHAWWKRGRVATSDLRASAPFFLISLAIGLLTLAMVKWYAQSHHTFTTAIPVHGFLPRVALAGLSLGFYLWTAVWPVDLSPLYPQWAVDPPSVGEFLPWPILGALVGWLWWARQRGILFGLGFFVLMLAPFLGLISANFMNFTWVMDHFLYLPIMGLIGLLVAGIDAAERDVPPSTRYTGAVALAVALLLLMVGSREYTDTFGSELNLWSRVVLYDPTSWLGHNNYGNVLVLKGRLNEARQQFEEALLIKPEAGETVCNYGIALLTLGDSAGAVACFEKAEHLDASYPELYANWGVALARLGRNQEAIEKLQQSLKMRPDYAEAHYNLGEVLFNVGRFAEAAEQYELTLQSVPNLPEAQHNWGLALAQMGRLPEALDHYREAVRLKPDYAEAQSDLADALLQTGQPAGALDEYAKAAQLNPDDPKIQGNWGFALAQLGRPAEAIPHYALALQMKPGNAYITNNWGNALAQEGRINEAIGYFRDALKLNPNYTEAHNNLAIALAEIGQKPEAILEFQKAIALNPNYVGAHDNLGVTLLGMGRTADAQKQFETVLRLDPTNVTATKHLKLPAQPAPGPPPAR